MTVARDIVDDVEREAERPVTPAEAARALGKSPTTIRRWITRENAPVVRPGSRGRGNGALVRVADLRLWRAGVGDRDDSERTRNQIAGALLDVLKRDAGDGLPAPDALCVPLPKSAALMLAAYFRIHRALWREFPRDGLPADIVRLIRVAENAHE